MSKLFLAYAFANEAQSAAKQPMAMQFLPLIMVVVVFYFLMFRPQKKQLEQEQKLLETLNKGDEVFTKSGILGTVVGITEKVVTLEVSEGSKLKVLKSQIGGLTSKIFEKESK